MAITIDDIKALRARTQAGVMDCRTALTETNGDLEKAVALLQQKGLATAAQRADRETSQGLVEAYVHSGRLGALVELNCETDFVARTEIFRQLAHDIAMQVTSMAPQVVAPADLPPGTAGEAVEMALLAQPFIKDPGKTIQDLINAAVASTGEKIQIRRFARFALGG